MFFSKVTESLDLDPRPEYHRVVLTWNSGSQIPEAFSTGNQISSRLLSVNAANALLLLPPQSQERTRVEPGEIVDAMIIARI